MSYQQHYGGVVWTNHSLSRLKERRMDQKMAWEAFQFPEVTTRGKQKDTWEYQRKYGNSKVTVIATQNTRNEWIILSCWIDPPLHGSIDIALQRKNRPSLIRKLITKIIRTIISKIRRH
jgi:hypothetical protein